MFDRLIKSDRLVTPAGVIAGQIGITDGKIAAILAPGEPARARESLDATGLAVLPGLVDIHTHLRDPGYTHKEDFYTGTAAAAAGGWSTVIAQPNTSPPLVSEAAFQEAQSIGMARAVVDFGVAAMATPANVADLAGLRKAGAMLFEVAMYDVPPEWLVASLADMARILEAGRATGTLVAVYATDHSLIDLRTRAVQAAGRVDPLAPEAARPDYAEAAAIAAVSELARGIGGPVHIRQISTKAGAEAVARARAGGPINLTAEVNPHHLFLSTDEVPGLGVHSRVAPPLRSPADVAGLWSALASGAIDLIATDHAPHTAEEKAAGTADIWKAASGLPVLETALPLLLDRVARAEITLEQVARWLSERPARRVGLYPRKGRIAPGADADLALVEIGGAWTVDPLKFQSKARWSPFAGRTLRGRVHATLVRGEVVFRDGRVLLPAGSGRLLRPGYGEQGM